MDSSRDWSTIVTFIIMIISASLAIAIPIMDMLNMFEGIPWINVHVPHLILIAVGILVSAGLVDRYILMRIQTELNCIKDIVEETSIRYLDHKQIVDQELERLVSNAENTIIALGAKSTASSYLNKIQGKVESCDVPYHRLLTGNNITHELHEHLESLISSSNAYIAWTHSEKYGCYAIVDKQVLVVLPTPYPEQYSGIILMGERNSRMFTNSFLGAFSESTRIDSLDGLRVLCKKCGGEIDRTESNLKALLRRPNQ